MKRIYPLPGKQRGLSLVELMISITIGLILLLGITTLIVQQSSTRDELEKSSRQIENGRYAMQLLHDDIEHAGFYGNLFDIPSSTSPLPGTMPDPCTTVVANLKTAMPLPIQGFDYVPPNPLVSTSFAAASLASPLTCLPAANIIQGSDILVIRRANSISTPAATVLGQAYLQATPASYVLDTGNNAASFTLQYITAAATTPATIRNYMVHIYFISPCSVMANGNTCTSTDDNSKPIPTLKMLELGVNAGGNTTVFNLTPLVEGIENLQLNYGIDSDNDGYPDDYTTIPATVANWSNVMAIRVNLLARSTECTTDYTDSKSYGLGQVSPVSAPASICTNGNYKRHAFSELVRADNPSGRRAQQ